MLQTVTSAGEAVTLRRHTRGDAPAIVEMMSDPQTTRWLGPLPHPYLLEHAHAFITGQEAAWARPPATEELGLVVDVGGRLVGQVGYRPHTREIGFVMTAAHTGRGIMTAAVRSFTQWVLAPDGLDQPSFVWRAKRGNWGSRRVVWSAGFSFDGISRAAVREEDGTVVDLWLGSLTRGEPTTPRYPWLEPPSIALGSRVLRAAAEADLDRIAEACADPETSRRLPMLPAPYCRADAEAYLAAVQEEQALGHSLVWVVAAADAPERLLGMVALSGMRLGRSPQCEVGYWVHPDARRRSVATVGCRSATRHALLPADEGGLGLHAVLLRAGVDNPGSQAVAAAAGFTRTGVDPLSELRRDGGVGDFIRYHFTVEQLEAAWAHPSSLR